MKFLARSFLLILLVFSSLGVQDVQANRVAEEEPPVKVLLVMQNTPATDPIQAPFDTLPRAERQKALVNQLQARAANSQKSTLSRLQKMKTAGKIQTADSFWINNTIAVTAPASQISQLASLPGVERVIIDQPVSITDPVYSQDSTQPNAVNAESLKSATDGILIAQTSASPMWNLGYRGQGVVVANVDSGVSLENSDLASSWRGGDNSWYDVHHQHNTPYDSNSGAHGTATMGIMVSQQYGLAPDAQWIAVKLFSDSGAASFSDVFNAYQWLIDPDGDPSTDDAPDVVNNSWTNSVVGCQDAGDMLPMRNALKALLDAGILPIFAAGNLNQTVSDGEPSAPVPSIFPEAFSVGAVDLNDQIAYFSSRGADTTCRPSAYVFPNLSAPGVGLKSSGLKDDTPSSFLDGTSFSAPYVSGALALILSAFPDLTPAQQRQALLHSVVDLGATGPDNVYGYGKLDISRLYASGLVTSEMTHQLFLPVLSTQ